MDGVERTVFEKNQCTTLRAIYCRGLGETSHNPNDQSRLLRHLIVFGNGQLVGIVSIGDVVKYRLDADDNLEDDTKRFIDRYVRPGEKRPPPPSVRRGPSSHVLPRRAKSGI
jgi:CBS domain-containing protein